MLLSALVPKVNSANGELCTLFATSMASSRFATGRMAQTGPNDSSRTIESSGESTSTTVGSMYS